MRIFAATIFAVIFTYSNALTLQSDRPDEYVKCDFDLARDYDEPTPLFNSTVAVILSASSPSTPLFNSTVAVKLSASSPTTVFDFGFERGQNNTSYFLTFFLMGAQGHFDHRSCSIQGDVDKTESLFYTSDDSGELKR